MARRTLARQARPRVTLDRRRRRVRGTVHRTLFRRRWPWFMLAGAVVLVGLLTFQAYRVVLHTANDLREAAAVLRARPSLVLGAGSAGDDAYDRLRGSIERATERVRNANWAFDVVGVVPVLGRPVHAAEHLTAAAAIELGAIDLARRTAADITGDDGSRGLIEGGVVHLPTLDRARVAVERVLEDLGRVEREVRAVRPIPFVGEADELKAQALAQLEEVRGSAETVRRGLSVLPPFLGEGGRRLYLLAILNPAELHGVGGAFLSYGIVSADRGRLELLGAGDPVELDPRAGPGAVPPPSGNFWLKHVYPVKLVNAFNGPDFAEGAALASRIAEARFGRALDGVIALDAVGLSYLLPAIGPVKHPGIVLTADNFVSFSTHEQYRLYPLDVRQRIQRRTIEQVWDLIGDPANPVGLFSGLSRSLGERRALLWSRFPAEQRLFEALDWAGRIERPRGDYFLLNHQNLGLDKLDYFLEETVHYRAHVRASGDVDVSATATLRNLAPNGLPKPVGNAFGSNMRTMVGVLAPAGARLARIEVEDDSGSRTPPGRNGTGYGKRIFTVVTKVLGGSRADVTFRYTVPAALLRSSEGLAYGLTVQHQPLLRPAELRVEVSLEDGLSFDRLPPGWEIADGRAVFRARLERDLRLTVPLR